MPAQVSCPHCGKQIEWSGNSPYRPFCSERCKLIDLGAWLTEKHAIPAESSPSHNDAEDREDGPKAD